MKPEPVPPRTVAIVLAAGLGTRMKSRLPKVLHDLCGRPMLGYVLEAAWSATDARPLVVVSPDPATVQEAFADVADFTVQAEPRGTGDAVRAALDALATLAADVEVAQTATSRCSRAAPLHGAARRSAVLDEAAIALIAVDAIDPANPRAGHPRRRGGRSTGSSSARTRPTRSSPPTRSTRGCTRSMRRGCAAGSGSLDPSPKTGEERTCTEPWSQLARPGWAARSLP